MNTLENFQKVHRNASIVVCGCGASLNDLARPERFITIGVNDVGRKFEPNYLVVVNPKNQFSDDRFKFVENSKASYLFTQLELGVEHKNVVKFRLGAFGGTDFGSENVLHYTNNSPYIAVCLAILMGVKRVGLIGVDFTDNHFFAPTGAHPLAAQFAAIDEQYRRLARAANARGVEIFNLSAVSRLTAFPKISADAFENLSTMPPKVAAKSESLRIVSYATTPVAGVPAILARCISARTNHSARCVWATNRYGNGVEFAGDVEWENQPRAAEDLLAEADLIIVHNGKIAPAHEKLFAGKAVLTMAHNYLWNVDARFVEKGFPGAVVGQYQATLPEFKDWAIVPNPVPFWEAEYQSQIKPECIAICYTPSGRHEKYPSAHRLYWHSKGYETTLKVLRKLAKRFSVKLEIVGERQISHCESLAMKHRSHIVIDECVTGSYHRNSLEGLAAGCVVVNGLGILPKVSEVLQICAGQTANIPFVSATLGNLEDVLSELIESGAENLIAKGAENRRWIEANWDFAAQWEEFWTPLVERALDSANRKISGVNVENKKVLDSLASGQIEISDAKKLKKGVSVVVPHGGRNRLPLLRTCLANLRQCAHVGEIVVVEMDERPLAENIARRWADKYVFLPRAGEFERGKTLNVGSRFAECGFVLWLDNDLLVAPDFIARAVAELRERNLDFLTPYSAVKYLSEADSERVMRGVLNPAECRPANVYSNEMTEGGAGLVRVEFLERYGGIPDGFRGWGGEDNGWMHKVRLLGRGERTKSEDQTAFHLFHALSGGYGGAAHLNANPHYAANVELLENIKAARNPQRFLESFPPMPNNLWADSARIYFVGGGDLSKNAARKLSDLFAANVETISQNELKESVKKPFDAVVFFDLRGAFDALGAASFANLKEKTLVVAVEDFDLTADDASNLRACFGVLTADEIIADKLKQKHIKHWFWTNDGAGETNFQSLALALAQPLSLLVNSQKSAGKAGNIADKTEILTETDAANLPVWIYWEGAHPRWIDVCRETIIANAANARFLTRETFADLRTDDLDIDLDRLHVAHRADFIRAYLLAKFGGLWIDADCLVMRDLTSTLRKLSEYDFIAHRERSGYFSNGFIAARPNSVTARKFYEKICRILRFRAPLGWISLGGEPLTEVLQNAEARFLELDVKQIQPICWSEPQKFFAGGDDFAHQNAFDERAICYMLSNREIGKYLEKRGSANLTADDSFFSFLARRALDEKSNVEQSENGNCRLQIQNDEKNAASKSLGNENRRRRISFYLEMFDKIAPRKVVDADAESGRWAFLLRDLFESPNGENSRRISIEAITEAKPKQNALAQILYDRVRVGAFGERLKFVEEKPDLLILGDYLTVDAACASEEIIECALDASDYVLLDIAHDKNDSNHSKNVLNLSRFSDLQTEQVAAHQNREDSVSFLLSRNDPKNLRAASRMTDVFTPMMRLFSRNRMESVSGPGSSLVQTAEIRRALPILCASLDVKSLLDAPCGDYNWLQKLDLRLEKYVGVDVVPPLVAQNRERYENRNRKFYAADITKDFLPRCDLILCRDCLVHLSFADVFAALRNFRDSGAKYLLTTTFPKRAANHDIATGDWRTLNFERAPFNFPAPRLLNERCTEGGGKFADKSLGLWKIADIEKYL